MLDSLWTQAPDRAPAGSDLCLSWVGATCLFVVVGVAYFLAARLSLALLTVPDGVAAFWPAAGVAAGTMLALGPAARMPVAAGVATATILANLTGDRNLPTAIVFAICNAGEATLIAVLIERQHGPHFALDSLPRVLGFFLATVVATGLSGVGGVAGFVLLHSSDAPVLATWLNWFASDAIGVVVVAPLVIGIVRALRDPPDLGKLAEGVCILAVLALASMAGFGWSTGRWPTILPLAIVLPLLIWPAARCPPVFAAAAVFIVGLVIVGTMTFGVGRLGDIGAPLSHRLLVAQSALIAVSTCALVVAALFAERRAHEALLSSSIEQLRNQERSFRRLLGSLPAAIHTTDSAGRITYCNKAAIDLWGVDPELGKDKCSDLGRLYYPDGTLVPPDECPTKVCLSERRAVEGQEAIFERRDGKRIPIIPYPAPLTDERGTIVGVVSMKLDITERKQAEQALAERNAQLDLAHRAARVGSYTYDIIAGTLRISRASAAIRGLSPSTLEIATDQWGTRVHRDDIQRLRNEHIRAFKEGRREVVNEFRFVRPGGEVRWIEVRSLVAYDEAGRAKSMTGVYIDVTDRRKAEDQKNLLIAELDHRVKNVLACVAAVAQRSRECSRSADQFLDVLNGRINSLANAHALLSRSRWEGVHLGELVRNELAPCMCDNTHLIDGPDIVLAADATQPLAMVLHELTTNASKYGALSNCGGQVSVRWERQSGSNSHGRLTLEWCETGGPPIAVPGPSGYGSYVIRDLIPYELGGSVDYVLAPEGVSCRVEIPAQWLRNGVRPRGNHEEASQLHAVS